MLDQSPSEDHAIWIAGYILSRGGGTVTRREIQRSYSALKWPDKDRMLSYAMQVLETLCWIRPALHRKDGSPSAWIVNPAVHDGRFRAIADRERARREAVRAAIASGGTLH
jgi:hypothetical protein